MTKKMKSVLQFLMVASIFMGINIAVATCESLN
ncbi:hypothetical protein LCGC14_0429700 [marine sediment metagenome]|uniref:Uncharacterized protein n=1 Tax=marine sediment metagenome TaxID=412755 RepID=A0A0F9SUI2_9ZZZZ